MTCDVLHTEKSLNSLDRTLKSKRALRAPGTLGARETKNTTRELLLYCKLDTLVPPSLRTINGNEQNFIPFPDSFYSNNIFFTYKLRTKYHWFNTSIGAIRCNGTSFDLFSHKTHKTFSESSNGLNRMKESSAMRVFCAAALYCFGRIQYMHRSH